MKIAIISYSMPGESFASIPRGTYAYAHFLKQFGHEVRLFDRADCRRPVRLLGDLKRWSPDVALAQHAGAMLAALWRRWGLLRGPVVHAWDDYYDEQSRLPAWMMRAFEKASVTGADHITSVSRYNIHRALAWNRPATFIPHGVEADQRPGGLVLDSARFKVMYLGDQALYKGMRRLMDAMRGVDADLFMVGTPNPDLQKITPPNVRFVGKIPPQEVQSALRQADVLVNPSDQDSNFKLQEYIRAGKPILGVPGRMEWAFQQGVEAWLDADLKEGLRRLIGDRELRDRLCRHIRNRPTFSWEEVVRQLEAVLSQVVTSAIQERKEDDE